MMSSLFRPSYRCVRSQQLSPTSRTTAVSISRPRWTPLSSSQTRRTGVTLLSLLFLFPVVSFGHQNAHPKIEVVTIAKDSLRVEVQYDIPGGDDPRKMRKLFDADQNGQIDPSEAEKLLDYIELSCASLVLRLDGKKIYPKRTKRSGAQLEGLVDRATEINFKATFESPLSLSGLHWLELAERGRLKEVPIAVALTAPLLLVASSQSPSDFAANRVGPAHIGNQEKLSIILLAP
jgi:hypothetical protein